MKSAFEKYFEGVYKDVDEDDDDSTGQTNKCLSQWLGCFGPKYSVSMDQFAHGLALCAKLTTLKSDEDYSKKFDRALESLKAL